MSRPAPRLYLVTDRRATGGRPLVSVIERALAGIPRAPNGRPVVEVAVQLREKDLGGAALLDLAHELRRVTGVAGVPLFVNGRVDVALAAGADGVHLAIGALDVSEVRSLAARLDVAISTHTVEEIYTAQAWAANFVVYGPVFETPSKQGLMQAKGLRTLTGKTNIDIPVLAIGGVNASNIYDVVESGFYGAACIRGILESADPQAATRNLIGLMA